MKFGVALLAFASFAGELQVPSPRWNDQVVYFLMTDRFDDGEPRNNDQGHGEFDPRNGGLYSGGDLAGALKRLDYIQGLGATALWLTPPVANVWFDPALKMAGYHGYWAEDFRRVDAHLGSLEDYRRLSRELHGRGMYLVQDVVVNHVGDYFDYKNGKFLMKSGLAPSPRPTQYPFSKNDARDAAQKALGAYHWTPPIADYSDPAQKKTHQMSGLDDLNTASPLVRDTLRESYRFWISTAGVDGFRFDTAAYVEHEFWRDFLHSPKGIEAAARAAGKDDFLSFGEIWGNVAPFSDKGDAEAASYLGSPSAPGMKAALNFPLAMDLRAVFAKGAPPSQLIYRLISMNKHYRGGQASVNFIDNHDMPRFRSEGGEPALIQALAALFSLPGLPVVYAGTEQGFTETRASMFAKGHGSNGKDHFDADSPLYGTIRGLAALRAARPELRRGRLVPLRASVAGPGLLAYRLEHEGAAAVVLFNSADEELLVGELDAAPGAGRLSPVFSIPAAIPAPAHSAGGTLTMRLPARAFVVLEPKPEPAALDRSPAPSIEGVSREGGRLVARGSFSGKGALALLVDGRLSRPVETKRSRGSWTASWDESELGDGGHELRAVALEGLRVSAPAPIQVSVPYAEVGAVSDPVGDDRGPSGAYRYPKAPGFKGRADIKRVSLKRRGKGAKLVIDMAHPLSDAWNPVFGFDHVALSVFIDLPGRKGASALPRLRASMPGGDWDLAAFLAGWKLSLHSSEGAGAQELGAPLSPAPRLTTDKRMWRIELELSPESLGGASLDGARVYVTSWDYDGAEGVLRPLTPEPGEYSFGGPADGPKIMDDALLVVP